MHERFAGGNEPPAHGQVRDVGDAPLQMASASARLRLAVRPEGEHGEEDTEAKHHQQSERGNHRGEERKRLRHSLIAEASPVRLYSLTRENRPEGRNSLPVVAKSGHCRWGERSATAVANELRSWATGQSRHYRTPAL
jgi:hypothetical protein